MERLIASALTVAVIAGVNVAYPRFARVFASRERQWLGFSAGIAMGYVFLYLLPKLTQYTVTNFGSADGDAGFMYYRLYAVALLGLSIYVGCYRALMTSHPHGRRIAISNAIAVGFYNLLIGYLVANLSRAGFGVYVAAAFAFGVHSLSISHQMSAWYGAAFERYLRWIMAALLVLGWVIAVADSAPVAVVVYFTAFIAGGVIANALSEELPTREGARLVEFYVGIATMFAVAGFLRSLPVEPG